MKALGTTILLAVVLVGSGGVFAAEKGKGRSSSEQWYADPDRGWIRSDERRDRKEDRRDNSKDRRSNQGDRDKSDKGRGRGSSDR